MVAFKKKILRPGVYTVKTPKGRSVEAFTKERIASIQATGNKMLESGLKIPAPYAHRDGDKVVPKPLLDSETPSWNAGINAGYWNRFEIDPTDGGLVGIVDVPGTKEDYNSPAGKVGTTVRETSIFLQPEFTDGLNRSWKDALYHVALVDGKAIEPGQDNFEDIEEPAMMCFSMSDEIDADSKQNTANKGGVNDSTPSDAETKPTSSKDQVIKIMDLMAQKLGIEMPDDTDETNFMDRLLTALVAQKNEGEEDTQPPEGGTIPSSPVAMSNNPDNVNVISDSKAKGLLDSLVKSTKAQLTNRINKMVAAGRIGRKYADESLLPVVDAIQMSMDDLNDDGSVPQLPIQMSLDLLEANTVDLVNGEENTEMPEGGEIPKEGDGMSSQELSEEEMDSVLADLG